LFAIDMLHEIELCRFIIDILALTFIMIALCNVCLQYSMIE